VSYKAAIKLQYQELNAIQRTFGDSLYDVSTAMTLSSGKEPVIAGYTESYGQGKGDAFLTKTNQDGQQLWFRTYGGSSKDSARDVVIRQDSAGYLLTGTTESAGQGMTDIFVLKTDNRGNVVWEKTYGDTLNEQSEAIIQTQDGNYVVGGWTTSFGATGKDVYLFKINSSGKVLWDYRYQNSDSRGNKCLARARVRSGMALIAVKWCRRAFTITRSVSPVTMAAPKVLMGR
jgi:hypothetical protein